MTYDFCVYLDAGHGGLDPQGNYVTPGKRFRHPQETFHGDGWIYEGVWNRAFTHRVAAKLTQLGIPYYIISHPWLDMTLKYRAETANWYHRNYKRGIYISNHANATIGHNARGFEVYTSPGRTASDRIANIYFNQVSSLLGDKIRMRADRSDGDHDKEARLYVLTQTVMPAILGEHLFFDQIDDARLMMDEKIQELFAEAQVRTIIEYLM